MRAEAGREDEDGGSNMEAHGDEIDIGWLGMVHERAGRELALGPAWPRILPCWFVTRNRCSEVIASSYL